MFVKPINYTYKLEEIRAGKNKIQFQRGPKKLVWELNAEKVLVYIFSNIVQVIGEWYEKESPNPIKGVLNIKLKDEHMKKARIGKLTASEITFLPWDDWFVYRIDKEEGASGQDTFNYNEAR